MFSYSSLDATNHRTSTNSSFQLTFLIFLELMAVIYQDQKLNARSELEDNLPHHFKRTISSRYISRADAPTSSTIPTNEARLFILKTTIILMNSWFKEIIKNEETIILLLNLPLWIRKCNLNVFYVNGISSLFSV